MQDKVYRVAFNGKKTTPVTRQKIERSLRNGTLPRTAVVLTSAGRVPILEFCQSSTTSAEANRLIRSTSGRTSSAGRVVRNENTKTPAAKTRELSRHVETQTVDCSICGEKVRRSAQKCRHCGEWLGESPPASPQAFQPIQQQVIIQQTTSGSASAAGKNRIAAWLFAWFAGPLGIHHFYLGRPLPGLLYLVPFLCLWWTVIVPVLLSVIAFVEGIIILCSKDPQFD